MIIHKNLGRIDGPREKSRDIDSLTLDYPEEIKKEILRIGEKYGATDPDGWLNNHWNKTKRYNDEFACLIKWEKLKEASFSNIETYFADLESLFRFKIRAIDDRIHCAESEPREQDVVDVISILKAYDISDFDKITNEAIKTTVPYFPYAVNYLIDNRMLQGTQLKIKEAKDDCKQEQFPDAHVESYKENMSVKTQNFLEELKNQNKKEKEKSIHE